MTDSPNERCVGHEPCPSCQSKDNFARYEDGHGYCFTPGCEYRESAKGVPENKPEEPLAEGADLKFEWQEGEVTFLKGREIREETCSKFDYQIGKFKAKNPFDERDGQWCHIANFRLNGKLVAQKIRFPDKEFRYHRLTKSHLLWGMQLWKEGGKKLVITEGEIDAMSVSQVQGNKWPVVSVPNGAASARKAIQENLEYVESFQEVIFMFDQDDQGREAAYECAMLLSPGKAKIAELPLKDPNEMLVTGRGNEIVDALWQAKTFRPDGILSGAETWDMVSKILDVPSTPYPWKHFNEKSFGIRTGEIVMVTAGSGIGKSTLCREIAYYLFENVKDTVGYIGLEESVAQTARAFMSLDSGVPLHLKPEALSKEEQHQAWDNVLNHNRLYLYDHWGSIDGDNLLSRMRYMVKALSCKWLFLDHISIMISGSTDSDERKEIDRAMTRFRTFVEEVDVGLFIVSHLRKRQGGKAFEDGGQISISDLRGSGSLYQLSDLVVGLERNQQEEEESEENYSRVRWLKNRFSGLTGVSGYLYYDSDSGRLQEPTKSAEDYGF
jgi:twinkle protein